jgi:hypothetical protein
MINEQVATMTIKARPDFGSIIARAGLTRTEVAREANISTRTLDALARPETYDRTGALRESTAWKIARALAKLTDQTPNDAFNLLFVEVSEAEPQL